MSTFSRPPIVLTNVISDTVDPSADVSCKYSFDSVKSATSCEAMIRAYCRPLATTREKIQIWKDVQEESSYGLFPSNNMLQSPEMEHITVADTIDAKRLVITNIIPALSRSDSVKKGDALKVQEFTRCRVIKSYSPYSCYTYIDVDTMQGVHECEYERRYLMYLAHVRECREKEAAMMNTSSDSESKSVSEEPTDQDHKIVLSPKQVNSNIVDNSGAGISDKESVEKRKVEMMEENEGEDKESLCEGDKEKMNYRGDEESKDVIHEEDDMIEGEEDPSGADCNDTDNIDVMSDAEANIFTVADVNDAEDLAYARLLHRIEIAKSQYLYDKMVIEIKSKAIEGTV